MPGLRCRSVSGRHREGWVPPVHQGAGAGSDVQERLRPEPAASVLDLVDVFEKHGEYGFAHASWMGTPNRVRHEFVTVKEERAQHSRFAGQPSSHFDWHAAQVVVVVVVVLSLPHSLQTGLEMFR